MSGAVDIESNMMLSGESIVLVLSHPEQYKLKAGIWYALNPPQWLLRDGPQHTLAGRLGITQEELVQQLASVGIQNNAKLATWKKLLTQQEGASKLEIHMERSGIGTDHVRFIAFGNAPLTFPKDQLRPGALVPQPWVVSKTLVAVAGLKRARSPPQQRGQATQQRQKMSASPPQCHGSGSTTARGSASAAVTAAASNTAAADEQQMAFRSCGQILGMLGFAKPYRDANGSAVSVHTLNKHFRTPIAEMSKRSGTRRELLRAASTVVHAVLSLLAPDALGTAAALAEPRQWQAHADPLRLAMVNSAQPKGAALNRMIAAQPIACALMESHRAAVVRKEPASIRAQILSPFTAQYSLRIFNECFETQLQEAGGPVTRHTWRFARWHAAIWLSGQTPPVSTTPVWRLKGHDATLEAVRFLTSGEHLQHVAHGVRRVRMSDGSWLELPKTERIQCAEELWRGFEASYPEGAKHVQRSRFLELANLVASTEQKSYGALDSFAEHNGREPARQLREWADEIASLLDSLDTISLLPSQSMRNLLAATKAHAFALKEKVTRIENFIKRELPHHVPACDDAEQVDDAGTCPEHCRACAFGGSNDASRCSPCAREHDMRCRQCAEPHSLGADYDLLVQSADAAVQAAASTVGAVRDGTPPTPAQLLVGEKQEHLDELKIIIRRAILKFAAFYAHERRAAHEKNVMGMLLRQLRPDGCIVVADWKVTLTLQP